MKVSGQFVFLVISTGGYLLNYVYSDREEVLHIYNCTVAWLHLPGASLMSQKVGLCPGKCD